VEPIPETNAALNEYLSFADTDIREELMRLGDIATDIVPQMVGMSLTVLDEDITFTVVASDRQAALLDASQYADDGPGEASLMTGASIEEQADDLLDERRWQTFAATASANGVASTLSLPIMRGNKPFIGLNLYASTRGAFVGHHVELADGLGASAAGIVTNADLSFSTRLRAVEALSQLDEEREVDTTAGALAAYRHLSLENAYEFVVTTAARAGVTPGQAARVIRIMLREA
jgi:GAF domain-containing protein